MSDRLSVLEAYREQPIAHFSLVATDLWPVPERLDDLWRNIECFAEAPSFAEYRDMLINTRVDRFPADAPLANVAQKKCRH